MRPYTVAYLGLVISIAVTTLPMHHARPWDAPTIVEQLLQPKFQSQLAPFKSLGSLPGNISLQSDTTTDPAKLLGAGIYPWFTALTNIVPGSFNGIPSSESVFSLLGNSTDPGDVAKFLIANLFPAGLTDTIPKIPFMLPPDAQRFKLGSCIGLMIGDCLSYGNSSNGLPSQLQGAWWQDSPDLEVEVVSSAGSWDNSSRQLSLQLWAPRQLGAKLSGSLQLQGGLWLPSGAAILNFLSVSRLNLKIQFNEDLTFGQIFFSLSLLDGFDFDFPTWLINWSMASLPEDSWQRVSSFFGVPSKLGKYELRQLVFGSGMPGPYFPQWLLSRSGRPVLYVEPEEQNQ